IRLLPFVIAGLLSGGLCWWLANLPLERLMGETFVATYYPGVVLAIALLALGKVLGIMPKGRGMTSAINLLISAVLAQILVVEYHTYQYESVLFQWEQGLYPSMYIGGELLLYDVFPVFLLPTPISSAIQASVIACGVAFAWDLQISRRRIIVRAAIYGALFAGLTILLTHLFSTMATDQINDILNSAVDQRSYTRMWELLFTVLPFITLLLWHSLLLLAIYMTVRPQSSTAAYTYEVPDKSNTATSTDEDPDKLQQPVKSSSYSSTDRVSRTVKRSAASTNEMSTAEIIATLRARKRTTRRFSWILLLIALLIVTGATVHYQDTTKDAFNSMIATHKQLLQQYASNHPLYALWPEIKACGGGLRTMKDLLWETDVEQEIKECELRVQGRLAQDLEDWGGSLDGATVNQPFSIRSKLLLQANSPEHPSYAFWSAVRECGPRDSLTEVFEARERNETLSGDQLYYLDCLKEKEARIQKSLEGYTESLPASSSASMLDELGVHMVSDPDYSYLRKPSRLWSLPDKFRSRGIFWNDYRVDDYRYSNYPPTGSFQEALNRSWKFGEVIQPLEKPEERSIYFHGGELQLLTPIVIDGETQAIILSELQTTEADQIDENIASEWQSYRNIIIITLFLWAVLFYWFEHRTLRKIPKGMDLSQWEAGVWRPSLLTLYLVDGFRYYHLINWAIFMIFSIALLFMPPQTLWHEELTWSMWFIHITVVMSLPLIFSLIIIPKMVVDYRLFAKGVPVPCKKIGAKTEELTSGHMRNGAIRTNTEYHDRHLYEALYDGKLYKFWAPAGNRAGDSAIALVNPNQTKQCLLLNAFCGSDK
ncbi:MAG: hypothetical protein KAS94_05290, partial [Desulfobulbaceae bacterium]|nr:hypothetical protein [Desulfobulbaceae bacterium]